MSIDALIKQLHRKNVRLALDGDDLKIMADKGALDQELKDHLSQNKAALIRWIKENSESSQKPQLPKLEKYPFGKEIPLSFAQQRLWFVDRLESDSTAYTICAATLINGCLQQDRLFRAIDKIIQRHETLRTRFYHIDGEPYQSISDTFEADTQVVNLEGFYTESYKDGDEHLRRLISNELSQKFDLEKGNLIKVRLYLQSDNSSVLLICYHHIISDGWSNSIFLSELAFYYSNQDKPSELPELSIQYKDFACWQRQCMQGNYKKELLDYWRRQLSGWQALNLEYDYPRTAAISRPGKNVRLTIDKTLLVKLKNTAQKSNVTLFTLLLSSFYILLYKYTGQTDICIGTDIANRTRTQLEGLIGFFVNQLVLRADLSGNPSIEQILAHIGSMTLQAYTHQDLPFDVLVDEILDHHDLSHTPFFPVKFIMQNTPKNDLDFGDWSMEALSLPQTHAKFEMTWSLTEMDNGLDLYIEYDCELFDPQTIERYAHHYKHVLSQLVKDTSVQLTQITLLDQQDIELYKNWNKNSNKISGNQSIAGLLEAYASTSPDLLAVYEMGNSVTYRQLNQLSNKIARYLIEWGVSTETIVGVCLNSSIDYIAVVCALSKLNAVLVPIDQKIPSERKAAIIQGGQIEVLLTKSPMLDDLPSYELNFIGLLCLDECREEYEQLDSHNINLPCHHNQLSYMIFTSGTTGKPKGVMVGNAGISTLVKEQREKFSVSNSSKILQFASIGFDASIWEIVMALGNGAGLYCDSRDNIMPGISLSEYIKKHQITHITLPPSALSVMPKSQHDSLQTLILAGEACKDEDLQYWKSNVNVFNAYGPSETTVCASVAALDKQSNGFSNSIGTPILGSEVYIISNDGSLCPYGVVGELCIGGISLGRGYWQDPRLTAEKFIPDPFSGKSGARLYRTGDKAKYGRSGSIKFLGRLDLQVKLRGYRIELQEIESQLLSLPAVMQAVATVNELEQSILAYIVTNTSKESVSAIKNQLRKQLPEYMIPKHIVELESIPVNVNGKVDFEALPEPKNTRSEIDWSLQPLSNVEKRIHDIWVNILEHDHFSKHENFFDIGGNSLLLIKVQELLHKEYMVDINVADLFKHPTIASLAEFLQQSEQKNIFDNIEQRVAKKRSNSRHRSRRSQSDISV